MRVTVAFLLVVAALGGVWVRWRIPSYEVYVLFVGLAIVVIVSDWPKPEWLDGQMLKGIRAALKSAQLSVRPPAALETVERRHPEVVQYVSTGVMATFTIELCDEIRSELIPKGIAYALLTLFLMFLVPHESMDWNNPEIVRAELLKAWATFSTFVTLAIWDLSRSFWQKRCNHRIANVLD